MTFFLLGAVPSVPLGWMLLAQYAETPQDPQKAIGYVFIVLYTLLFWASVSLFAAALNCFFTGKRPGGMRLLLPALAGLAISCAIFWNIKRSEARYRLLTEGRDEALLWREATPALKRDDVETLALIAQNPNAPGEVLTGIVEARSAHSMRVLRPLAQNPGAPQAVLAKLSKHTNRKVRSLVLENPSAGDEVVAGMLNDVDPRIREAARARKAGAERRLPASHEPDLPVRDGRDETEGEEGG